MLGFTMKPYTHCLNCGKPTVRLYDMKGNVIYVRDIRGLNRLKVPVSHGECSSCGNKYYVDFSDEVILQLISMESIQSKFNI